jgi:glyoxylase-like metal-dependent hydrolase (beta-lactamase superfamily II)
MGKLQIVRKVLGMVQTNTYLAHNTETGELLIIDPAAQADQVIQTVTSLQGKPVAILLTHGHFDHCGAAEALADHYKIPILAGVLEEEVLADSYKNLSEQFGAPFTAKAERYLKNQETLELAGFSIRVYETPGHTKGGVCYYFPEEGVLFSGDTLFYESVGRTDFPTGSMSVLVRSVRGLLGVLPDETQVFPGHNSETSIAHEKEYNPFI